MAAAARLTSGGTAVPRLVAAVLLLAVWQGLAMSGLFFRDVIPPVPRVVAGVAGVLLSPEFYANLPVTLLELLVAMLVGGGAGLLVGLVLGSNRFLAAALERWVAYLGPTPKIVLFPVLLLICGVGAESKMAMGAVSCFFPVTLAVASGVRGIDPILLRVGRSFRASGWARVTKIVLPAMAAPLITGARLGFGVALIGVLLAETKLSNQGVGFLIMQAYHRFDMPAMYGLLIVTVAFAAAVNFGAERLALRLAGRSISGS